jgi:hypothetical protein
MIIVGDCILWTGCRNRKGYGMRKIGGRSGKVWLTHRWAWAQAHGDPGELCVLHKCDTPACHNVDHLFLGTRADNNADMAKKGRANGRPPVLRGEMRPGAKLTASDVARIRASSEPQAVMAAEYGVTQSNISRIRSGKTWL